MLEQEEKKDEFDPSKDPRIQEWKEKILREKKNVSSALEERNQTIEELKTKIKEIEENSLKEKENYKELYERAKSEGDNAKKQAQEERRIREDSAKLSALKAELIKQGAKPDRIDLVIKLVDITKIKYNDEYKTVLGADDEARMLKEKLPDVFGANIPEVSHEQPKQSIFNMPDDLDELSKMAGDKKTNDAVKEIGKKFGVNFY